MEKIGSTIAKKRKEAKLSQGELAEELKAFGFAPSAASISSWEKDVSVPNALQFMAVCKVLKIDNILGEFENAPDAVNDVFNGLNEEGRKRAKEYISLLLLSKEFTEAKPVVTNITEETVSAGRDKKRIDAKKASMDDSKRISKSVSEDISKGVTRILKLYNLPASAGTGEFLDGEDYTEVEVGPEVSMAADFGIRIKGNSMEPRYVNGQTVWIKRCENLQNGEIGIFFLNGNAYCKKLQKSENGLSLISLNPDYDTITVTEEDEISVFGKVLN
ncbi:MAG: XRE family transcriptional regulator [Lachnospiraceae bacterium]|nr:XRE family transcriptional regulator [Lachnospiraceae bacterium]